MKGKIPHSRSSATLPLSPPLETNHFKRRLLFLMEENDSETDVYKEMEVQLKAKDTLIDQLNAKLITAEAIAKRHESEFRLEKDRPLKEIWEEKEHLCQELDEMKGNLRKFEAQNEELSLNNEALKETLDVQVEALTEDIEALREQLQQRSEAINTAKKDITEMSQIVQDLTRLNTELNQKIADMNAEMEAKNSESYQAVMKVQQTEMLEKELIGSKMEVQGLQEKLRELQEREGERKDLQGLLNEVGQKMVRFLGEITISDTKTENAVREMDEMLKLIGEKARKPRELPERKIAALKEKLASWKVEAGNYKKAASIAISEKQYHQSNVDNIRAESARLKREYDISIKQLEDKVKLIQGSVDYAFRTRKKVEISLETTASDLARKNAECVFLASQIRDLKDKESDLRSSKEDLKRSLNTLQDRFIASQKTCSQVEQVNLSLKKDLQTALAKGAALQEELWKRDNQLLRKECKKLKLMEQVDSLRSTIQINYTRFRTSESDKGKKPTLPQIKSSHGFRSLLKPNAELLQALEQSLQRQQTITKEDPLSVERLKAEYFPYLKSVVTAGDTKEYPHLKALFAFLSVGSLSVQQVLEQLASLSS